VASAVVGVVVVVVIVMVVIVMVMVVMVMVMVMVVMLVVVAILVPPMGFAERSAVLEFAFLSDRAVEIGLAVQHHALVAAAPARSRPSRQLRRFGSSVAATVS
jgi:hypothetical protein